MLGNTYQLALDRAPPLIAIVFPALNVPVAVLLHLADALSSKLPVKFQVYFINGLHTKSIFNYILCVYVISRANYIIVF